MVLEGSQIAAILTGILALSGALATAYLSGWNERRNLRHKNRKALARYAVPLLVAAWDLANWFYDICEDANYSPQRCTAYGNGWNSQFTSYLLGQYFAGVHILRLKTHFLAHMKGDQALALKQLLWKIQDEFVTMEYEDRESLEMRWFEGDILAVQEHMTEDADLNGDGIKGEMQTIGYVEFQKLYRPKTTDDSDSPELGKILEWYETEFQRIVYRRFKQLYSTKWTTDVNPQQPEQAGTGEIDRATNDRYIEEERIIEKERKGNPNARLVVPDHRIRRLQHLLSDLVILLDDLSRMKFNRPVRRCAMTAGGDTSDRIPCDCHYKDCNPQQQDFEHRQLHDPRSGMANRLYSARRTPTWANKPVTTRKITGDVLESAIYPLDPVPNTTPDVPIPDGFNGTYSYTQKTIQSTCNISRKYIDFNAHCIAIGCYPNRIQWSNNIDESDAISYRTPFDEDDFASAFLGNLVQSAGKRNNGNSSDLFKHVYPASDVTLNATFMSTNGPAQTVPLSEGDPARFAFLMSYYITKSFNTYYTLSQYVLSQELQPDMNGLLNNAYEGSFFQIVDAEGAVYKPAYRIYWEWIPIGFIACTILLAVAIGSYYLRVNTLAPDIFGFVSSLTRGNPHIQLPSEGSTSNGIERARMLKKVKVKLGNVQGVSSTENGSVGTIGLAPVQAGVQPLGPAHVYH